MPRLLTTAFVVVVLFAVACSSDPDVEDYDQDCAVDADCVTVLTGDPCDCDCTADAIRLSDEPRYRKDRGSCNSGCANQCGPCGPSDAICRAGRCVVGAGRSVQDAGADSP